MRYYVRALFFTCWFKSQAMNTCHSLLLLTIRTPENNVSKWNDACPRRHRRRQPDITGERVERPFDAPPTLNASQNIIRGCIEREITYSFYDLHKTKTLDTSSVIFVVVVSVLVTASLMYIILTRMKVPGENHTRDPCNTTNNVIVSEFFSIHLDNAGDDGSKCSNDRKKSCCDDCNASMLIVKFLRLV